MTNVRRKVDLFVLALGITLSAAYVAWQLSQRRGPEEFGYAPFTPVPVLYNAMRAFTYEQWWGHVMRAIMLGPGLCLITYAWVRLRTGAITFPRWNWSLLASIFGVALSAFMMLVVLRGRAIVDDEHAYSMQAEFMTEGHLQGHSIGLRPTEVFSVETMGGYSAKYLPGEAIVQTVGVLVGVPALLHIPLYAMTIWLWYRILRDKAPPRITKIATAALALSPMLAFTSATGLSHASSLFCLVLAGFGLSHAERGKPMIGSILASVAMGFGVFVRPQSAVPTSVILAFVLVTLLIRERKAAALLVFFGISALVLCFTLLYNHHLAGSWLKLPWFLQCNPEHFGFGPVWKSSRFTHTPIGGLLNLGVVAARFNAWWLGLPTGLALIPMWLLVKQKILGLRRWYGVAGAVMLFEFLYYSPGVSDTGPIYHYELILPASLVAAIVIDWAMRKWRDATCVAMTVHVVGGTLAWDLEQAARTTRLVRSIHADSDAALSVVVAPAVIFHELWPSEVESRGWIDDSFPRRIRSHRAPIVTFPRMSPSVQRRVLADYPGRQCWYYRRHPDTSKAELHRCEDVPELLSRSPIQTDQTRRALWLKPTAYLRTDYDPMRMNLSLMKVSRDGRAIPLCCEMRELEADEVTIPPGVPSCIPDDT